MESNTEFKHPELREGEYYWGNFTKEDYESVSWKTKRMGEVAYDIWGKVIPYNNEDRGRFKKYYPVFISLSERQEYLDREEETEQDDWSVRLRKEIFNTIYQWGRDGVVADENSPIIKKLLDDLEQMWY